MLYPIRSTILAVTIYFLVIVGISFGSYKKNHQPKIAFEIEAEEFGDYNQHQHNSKLHNKSLKNPTLEDSKNSKINHQHLDNLPHQTNQNLSNNLQNDSNNSAQKIKTLFQPLPEIPEDLRYEAFSSNVEAKFFIAKNGSINKVELIQPSQNPRLNFLLLKSLQKWKFEESSFASTQIIKVKFKVEE